MTSPFLFISKPRSPEPLPDPPSILPISQSQWVDPNALFEYDLGISKPIPSTPDPLPISYDHHPHSTLPSSSPLNSLHDIRAAAALSLPSKTARRPALQNQLAHNQFRPANIPADCRILLWTTPHSLLAQSLQKDIISNRLQVKMYEGLLAATTDETRQAYGAGLLRFNQFCDAELIPETLRMPASSTLLGAFVAENIGTCTGKCIPNWLNGLWMWHLFNDAEWHGQSGWLPSLKKAAEKKGLVFKRPLRGPIERAHLLTLQSHLDLTLPRDAARWATATTAFWGCRRLGELLPISTKKFTIEHDVARSTPISRTLINGRHTISFHLPWTKTTGIKGGECHLTEIPGDLLCPIQALNNHFKVNHSPPPATPLFAFRANSSWVLQVKHEFIQWINLIFREHNLEHVFGHSFRIGGSLAYLLLGVEPEVIMKIGGWTSLCFLIYWRRLEQVIPVAIATAMESQSRMKAFAASHNLPFSSDDLNFDLSTQ